MRQVNLFLPEAYIRALDQLVKKGLYASRNQAIRVAVCDLLKTEYWKVKACAR